MSLLDQLEEIVYGVPSGYRIVETNERVDTGAELVTRFRWRAERRKRHANARRLMRSYRYEVVPENGRYTVAVFQNVLEKIA